jgi:hypothetical protein
MHVTGQKPELADQYGEHACAYGYREACSFLATSLMVRALAARNSDTREDQITAAVSTFRRGCDLEDWSSCWLAATLYEEGALGDERNAATLRGRANALAETACHGASSDACATLGHRAYKRERKPAAAEYYRRACEAQRSERPSAPYQRRLRRESVCERATELGAAPEPSAKPVETRESPPPGWVQPEVFKQQRISGRRDIAPPEDVMLRMARKRIHKIRTTVVLCISSLGTVTNLGLDESSGYAIYDLKIFNTLRAWRYRPLLVGGKPMPVCTSVRFTYQQT